MLRDLLNSKDIHGNQDTRRFYRNTVSTFKPDTRLHAKKYKFLHCPVVELHGSRYLACVKSGNDSILIETDARLKGLVVVAEMDSSIYSEALQEGLAQIKHHVQSRRSSSSKKAKQPDLLDEKPKKKVTRKKSEK